MEPVRKSNGYTKEGKKKYLRFFKLKKISVIKQPQANTVIEQSAPHN